MNGHERDLVRIGDVRITTDGSVVSVDQAAWTFDDLIGGSALLVGIAGIGAAVANPVSGAAWLLVPFIGLLATFGVVYWWVRITGRSGVHLDRTTWQGRAWRAEVDFGRRPRAVTVRTRYLINDRLRVMWAVDLVAGERSLRMATALDRARAERVVSTLDRLLTGGPGPHVDA